MGATPPVLTERFGPLERHETAWTHHLDRAGALAMVASRSYVITLPEARRAELLGAVSHLLASHPEVAGRDDVALPYRTSVYRSTSA